MNAPQSFTAAPESAPEILRYARSFSQFDLFRAIQLLIRELPIAEAEADIYLARVAVELIPDGRQDDGTVYSEEDAEFARNSIYPDPRSLTAESSRRHRLDLERRIADAERAVNGRPLAARVGDAQFYGSRFGG